VFSVLFDEKKMKKTLLAIIITSSLSTSVLAQTQTTETNLADSDITETFVVTANRTTQEKFDVLAAVDVFD
jgi:outer membrane cobalamin receptor